MSRHDEPTESASSLYASVFRVGEVVRCARTGRVGLAFHWEVAGDPGRGQPPKIIAWFTPEQVARNRRAMCTVIGWHRDAATAPRRLDDVRRCLALWREMRHPRGQVNHQVIKLWYL